jgi:hypothetical protein
MNPKQHSYYNEILSSIDVSLYDDAISKILDVFSQYNVPILHTSTRIKGAYSIFVKYINKKHKNIYDLYGLELIIDEDVFFSTYYIEILRNLSKLSYVQSINDLSVVS